jgi:DHA1 family multidrug resistance protein-like MFS transporter
MFEGMGIQWAATLLGCVAVVLVPIPFIFYRYGSKIRERSAYASTGPSRGMTPAAAAASESNETTEKENGNFDTLAGPPRWQAKINESTEIA